MQLDSKISCPIISTVSLAVRTYPTTGSTRTLNKHHDAYSAKSESKLGSASMSPQLFQALPPIPGIALIVGTSSGLATGMTLALLLWSLV